MSEKENKTNNKLIKFLNRVFLGGIIKECVMRINDKGKAFIRAVDMTNTLFLSCSENLNVLDKGVYGLGDLGLLCKYLSILEEKENFSIEKSKNRLIFNRKEKGKFKYLLTNSDVIPTDVEEKDAIKKLLKTSKYEITLNENFRDDFLSYVALTGLKVINIQVDNSLKVILSAGGKGDHQFSLKLGKAKSIKKQEKKKKFIIPIYADYFRAVIQQLEWSKKKQPKICFAPKKPIVIIQDNKNAWGILPILEEEN